MPALATSVAVLAASVFLTGLMRGYLMAQGVLDIPNSRSSHTAVTPRGGGLSIVLAATAGLRCLALIDLTASRLLTVLASGGAFVALVGFVDDRRRSPPGSSSWPI